MNNYAREKTPKYNEETALKAKKRSRKQVNLLYKWRAEVYMDDKNTFVLMTIACPVVLAITRTTKQNVQTIFALLEKKILMWIAISNRACQSPIFVYLSQWL